MKNHNPEIALIVMHIDSKMKIRQNSIKMVKNMMIKQNLIKMIRNIIMRRNSMKINDKYYNEEAKFKKKELIKKLILLKVEIMS